MKSKIVLSSIVFSLLLNGCYQNENNKNNYSLFQDDKGKNALIILWDRSGLNQSCDSLLDKNIESFDNLISKNSLGDMNVDTIKVIAFDQSIEEIIVFKDNESRVRKFVQYFSKDESLIKQELKTITKDSAKDVYGALSHVKNLIDTDFKNYNNVGLAVFSNLRQSVNIKNLKANSNITFADNVHIKLFAKSGLSCIKDTTLDQIQYAEKEINQFWLNKLNLKDLVITNTY